MRYAEYTKEVRLYWKKAAELIKEREIVIIVDGDKAKSERLKRQIIDMVEASLFCQDQLKSIDEDPSQIGEILEILK